MSNDLERLQSAYEARPESTDKHLYSLSNTSYLFAIQQRERAVLNLLKHHKILPLEDKRILEVGCGRGGVLQEYRRYGASPANIHGIDFLEDRVVTARLQQPNAHWSRADGQALPYPGDTFDIVLQYTALSSLLNPSTRQNVAAEMMRVLKQSSGVIIWYDFWLNPKNPNTHGITRAQVRQLFPQATVDFRQITLAPPIARRLVPISWLSAILLEKLRVLNSHLLVLIKPKSV